MRTLSCFTIRNRAQHDIQIPVLEQDECARIFVHAREQEVEQMRRVTS